MSKIRITGNISEELESLLDYIRTESRDNFWIESLDPTFISNRGLILDGDLLNIMAYLRTETDLEIEVLS